MTQKLKMPNKKTIDTPSPPSTVKPARAISHLGRSRRASNLSGNIGVCVKILLEKKDADFFEEDTMWALVEIEAPSHSSNSFAHSTIFDLDIYIEECPNYQVLNSYGRSSYQTLKAGHTVTKCVLVKISALRQIRSEEILINDNQQSSCDHVLADLEGLLGVHYSEVFRVEVRYKHSLFPDNTNIAVHETCTLKRTINSSPWAVTVPSISSESQNIYKSMARHVSKMRKEDALAFINDFEKHSQSLNLPSPITKIKSHFRTYQSSLASVSPRRKGSISPHLPRFSFETNSSAYENLHEKALVIPKRSASYSPAIMKSVTSSSPPDENDDKARQIWHLMRQDSKGHRRGLTRNSSESLVQLENRDKTLKAIRQRALRNKRSVGADTLRSIATGVRSGIDAPWL